MPRAKVIPLQRRDAKRVRVVVRGPADPLEADALRRAIVRDLAGLAVDLLAEDRLPPSPACAAAGSER
jgi:hypothetical protein